MARVCVPLAPGFEEIEAVTIIDVLRRAGIEVRIAGLSGGPVEGSHGITIATDTTVSEAKAERWDMVVLPGGMPGSTNLRRSPEVADLVRTTHERGCRVGAICAAPIVLQAAGLLRGRKATSYPSFAKELTDAEVVEDPVVRDGRILTSRGPGTAFEFALAVVEDLAGREAAESLRSAMLVRTP